MKYHYFISYFSSTNENIPRSQISNCELIRDTKISDYEDLMSIGKLLEEENKRKDVVILNYVLLKKSKGVRI